MMEPWGAIVLGTTAGIISVVGCAATSAPGVGSPSHICTGTALAPPTSAHRNWAHPAHICHRLGGAHLKQNHNRLCACAQHPCAWATLAVLICRRAPCRGGYCAVWDPHVVWGTCTRTCERRYVYIQPKLQEVIGLEDTCGIHNLHAMPGFLGGTRH